MIQSCFPALSLLSILSRAPLGTESHGQKHQPVHELTPRCQNETGPVHRIIESLRLEKTSKIIKSNRHPIKAHRPTQMSGGFSKIAPEGVSWHGKMRCLSVRSLIHTSGSSAAEPKAGPTTFFLVAHKGFTTSFSRPALLSFITSPTL